MVERHNKSFFGKKTGLIFDSGPLTTPAVFLTFIKKKKDGSWEKPSKKEGQTIKLSLEDIGFVLGVLRGNKIKWETVHTFKDKKTSISFEQNVLTDRPEWLKIKAGGLLSEQVLTELNLGELEVFKALLEHVFQEKITHATILPKRSGKSEEPEETEELEEELESASVLNEEDGLVITEEKIATDQPSETTILKGLCKGETEKALLIHFEGSKEIWVPKSTVRSTYDAKSDAMQKFEIDTWILRKNNVL